MQLEFELQPIHAPVLLIASSPEAAWQGGAAGWFARIAAQACFVERPAVVVVPTRSHALALKAHLLAAGQSALGVHFATPPYLRALLRESEGRSFPTREHLRLLLAIAAEEQLANTGLPEPERLAAISVRRTPDHLLRLIDQLGATGWEFDQIDLPAFRSIVHRFQKHLAACDFDLFAESDRAALSRTQKNAPLFSELLVSGFHAAHWPAWHLLRAAVQASENATILLQYPRGEAADLDSSWIGSWEEAFGEARPAVEDDAADESRPEHLFLAGMDTQEQAAAITAAAVHFLSDQRCSRLGIVFPAPGALSRLVASSLTRQSVPHYDAMGQMLPGIFESGTFSAWMELQRTPRLNVLLRFLAALGSDHILFGQISRDRIDNALRNALSDIAIDDLAVLTACCRERNSNGEAISAVMDAIRFLPDRATFPQFLRATSEAFDELKWPECWREIEARSSWTESLPSSFSRTLYLRWLGEIASTLRITRDSLGNHPYARVQLLTAAQAEDQTWSYLILAGLNEGVWPAAVRGDFLSSEEIEAFNSRVQNFNRAVTRRGRQGEGHLAIRAGKTLFLGSQQERQLARAQFASLVESASLGLALTAGVIQEEAPERVWNPSEFFNSRYHELRGIPVSQTTIRSLRDATKRWVDQSELRRPDECVETRDIVQTRVAYQARREAGSSGEYDFALRCAPKEIKPLSVSEAEALLKSPALVWMKRFLDVEGAEDSTYAWSSTVGQWTHHWLASIGAGSEGFVALPPRDEIERHISAAAEQKRSEALRFCGLAGKNLPDWWQSGWENAFCLAQTLGGILATAEDWRWAAPEWRLEAQPVTVSEGQSLLIRGRADLLLARTETLPAALSLPSLWIVDFKTGNKKSLALKKSETPEQRQKRVVKLVVKREALQLALYALAAKQLGARDIRVSLISPLIANAEPQLNLDDFAECEPAFIELARMQETGVFGMRGFLRGQFTFTGNYPLATLAIDRDVLEERWERTHPALAVEEEIPW